MKNGFTLIELMIAITVLVILMVGGTFVLLQTLGSRGQNQVEVNINQAGSQAMESVEQSIRFAFVESLGGGITRSSCISAGQSGVTGSSVTVSDSYGQTRYYLTGNRLASESATIKYLSSTDVVASNMVVTWYCVTGFSDKLRIKFDMTGGSIVRTFSRDINMYNSGI